MLENHHTSLSEFASELNSAHGMSQLIVIDILSIRCITTKLVPKEQKYLQKMAPENVISKVKNDPAFMKQIITGDDK